MTEGRPLTSEETARVVELAMHFAREGMTEELAGFVDHGLPAATQDEDGNTAFDAGGLPRPRGARVSTR